MKSSLMLINFTIADKKSTLFYLAGTSSGHSSFMPVSTKQVKIVKKVLKDVNYQVPSNYQIFSILKKYVLTGVNDLDQIHHEIEKQLSVIALPQDFNHKAKATKNKLGRIYKKNELKIIKFFHQFKLSTSREFQVLIVPYLDEAGESLDDVIVIGDGGNPQTVFAILLEEILHSLLKIPNQKTFSLTVIDQDIFNESYTAAILYHLLRSLNYSDHSINSVVFDWQGGKRKKLVEKILERLTIDLK